MDLRRLGVDEMGLDRLAVADEERVGQRAVAPEHAGAVQFHQQGRNRRQQLCAQRRLGGRQAHKQAAELPGALKEAGDQQPVVGLAPQHGARRADGGQRARLERTQDVVLAGDDAVRGLFDGQQLAVDLDEADDVTARSHRDVAERDGDGIPVGERRQPRECEQRRRRGAQLDLRRAHRPSAVHRQRRSRPQGSREQRTHHRPSVSLKRRSCKASSVPPTSGGASAVARLRAGHARGERPPLGGVHVDAAASEPQARHRRDQSRPSPPRVSS